MKQQTNPASASGMPAALSDKLFSRFSSFIYSEAGIKLPPAKKLMLEARLNKRLKARGFATFNQYADFVFSDKGRAEELEHLINVVSTNKTDFFRESAHFDYLVQNAVPALMRAHDSGMKAPFRIWSAG